jgi:hypothetical protein
MNWKLFAPMLLLVTAPAAAQSMNAETFYQRATALQKKGVMALFSGDLKALTKEGQAAGAKAREQRLAAIKAGQKPRFCPPQGPVSIDSKEFVSRLSAIPATERQRIDMTEATARILTAKFPCKSG